jgi:aprataxin
VDVIAVDETQPEAPAPKRRKKKRDILSDSSEEEDDAVAFPAYAFPGVPPRSHDWKRALRPPHASLAYASGRDGRLVYDGYPKARRHLLGLAAPGTALSRVNSVRDLRREHLPALQKLHAFCRAAAEALGTPCRVGYHARPSLEPLHVHIISIDLDSEFIKQKKHFLSFATDRFVDAAVVERALAAGALADVLEPRDGESGACHRCGAATRNLPALKRHLAVCAAPPPAAWDVVGRQPAPAPAPRHRNDEEDDDDDDEWLERAPASRPTPKPAGKRPRDDDDEEDDDDDNGWPTPSRAANRVTTSGRRAPAAAEIIVLDETQDDAAMAPPAPDADGAASVVTEESGRAPRRAPAPKPAPAPPASVREHFSPKPAPREPFFSPAPIPAPQPTRFSLAERAPPASPTGAELAAMFPAEGDTVEIIWQKDTTLEVDGAGDRCIVASLRGPFPDKKKKRRSSTSLPAYHVYAELRSLVRLAGDQEHAFERVDETDRRPKHVHPKYKLSLHARGTVWRRVDVDGEGEDS